MGMCVCWPVLGSGLLVISLTNKTAIDENEGLQGTMDHAANLPEPVAASLEALLYVQLDVLL